MASIVGAYLSAAFQLWAASKTRRNWREFWRLKKLGIQWQLKDVQKFGENIEIKGPIIIKNAGTIEIGNQVMLEGTWHKPLYISLGPGARLTMEDNSLLNYGTEISAVKEVFIGEGSLISIDCLIYDTDWHTLDGLDRDVQPMPVHIGRGVWLGARVVVLKGVTIGDNTVVAANSVVTKDLPANVLAAGSPAKVIRPIQRFKYNPSGKLPPEWEEDIHANT